jgi:hypothetical protein
MKECNKLCHKKGHIKKICPISPSMYPPCILIIVMFLLIIQRVSMLNLLVPQLLVTKRKPFRYQRPWLLTSKDPNKFGYLKEIDSFFVGEL